MEEICTFKKPFTGHLFRSGDGLVLTCRDKCWRFARADLLDTLEEVLKYEVCWKGRYKTSLIHVRRGTCVYTGRVTNWEEEGPDTVKNIIKLFL